MTDTLDTINIEQRKFDDFMKKFKSGKFGTQRLGQAFESHFNLSHIQKIKDVNIWSKDGEQALNCIRSIVTFS
jgi:hypothetical protein